MTVLLLEHNYLSKKKQKNNTNLFQLDKIHIAIKICQGYD